MNDKGATHANIVTGTPIKNKTILVTGAIGFIGSNLILELICTQSPANIIGIDDMIDYYDVSIKEY